MNFRILRQKAKLFSFVVIDNDDAVSTKRKRSANATPKILRLL
jgi:hypothetical protein